VLLGVERGMFVAVVLSVLDHLRQEYSHKDVILTLAEGRLRAVRAKVGVESAPGLIVYRFGAPLFFANADYFTARVQDLVLQAPHPVKWFVFDLVSTEDVDYTGGLALMTAIRQLQQRGVIVALAEGDDVRREIERLAVLHAVTPDRVFESVGLALDAYQGGV